MNQQVPDKDAHQMPHVFTTPCDGIYSTVLARKCQRSCRLATAENRDPWEKREAKVGDWSAGYDTWVMAGPLCKP